MSLSLHFTAKRVAYKLSLTEALCCSKARNHQPSTKVLISEYRREDSLTKLLRVNRWALIFVTLAAMSMLLMFSNSTNCGLLKIMVSFNFIASITAVLLVIIGLTHVFVSKQIEKTLNILCFFGVFLVCCVMAPFNIMAGIGLGHCYG